MRQNKVIQYRTEPEETDKIYLSQDPILPRYAKNYNPKYIVRPSLLRDSSISIAVISSQCRLYSHVTAESHVINSSLVISLLTWLQLSGVDDALAVGDCDCID